MYSFSSMFIWLGFTREKVVMLAFWSLYTSYSSNVNIACKHVPCRIQAKYSCDAYIYIYIEVKWPQKKKKKV